MLDGRINPDERTSTTNQLRRDAMAIQPLLNPISIGLRNASRSTHAIEKFSSKHDGTIPPRCGRSGGGHIHIHARRQQDRIVSAKSQHVYTRYPRVTVSMNHEMVVTSFPTSSW